MVRRKDRRSRPLHHSFATALAGTLAAALAVAVVVAGCAGPGGTPGAPTEVATPAGVAASASPAAGSPSAAAAPTAGDPAASLAARLTPDGLRVHLAALDDIAAMNGGSRAVGTAGFDATVEYATKVLADAGYDVVTQPFEASTWSDPGGNVLRIVEGDRWFRDGTDFLSFGFSPSGEVEGPVVAVADPCAVDAFGAAVDGAIVVVGPGACDWLAAATRAGASAIVIVTGRSAGDLPRMIFEPGSVSVPVVMASTETGAALAAAAGSGAHLRVTGSTRTVPTENLVAELPGTDPGRVIVLGAHLDSAVGVPGIDDDGTGVAAVLETARLLSGQRPKATIRFALWSAEELGLLGAAHYVKTLPEAERDRIEGYLNADGLGAVNGIRAIYAGPRAVRKEGPLLSRLGAYLKVNGLDFEMTDVVGRTDALPFNEAGIPVAGVISVRADEATDLGAASGSAVAMDPCYHLPCDDIDNVDLVRTTELADALAWAVADLAWAEAGTLASPAP